MLVHQSPSSNKSTGTDVILLASRTNLAAFGIQRMNGNPGSSPQSCEHIGLLYTGQTVHMQTSRSTQQMYTNEYPVQFRVCEGSHTYCVAPASLPAQLPINMLCGLYGCNKEMGTIPTLLTAEYGEMFTIDTT